MKKRRKGERDGCCEPVIIDAIFSRYRKNPFKKALNALSPRDYWCLL